MTVITDFEIKILQHLKGGGLPELEWGAAVGQALEALQGIHYAQRSSDGIIVITDEGLAALDTLISARDKLAADKLSEALERRSELTERLSVALAHVDLDTMLSIITSFIPLDEIEKLVRFQERAN